MKWYWKPNRRVEGVADDFVAPSDWVECQEDGSALVVKPKAAKAKKVSNPPADEESAGSEE